MRKSKLSRRPRLGRREQIKRRRAWLATGLAGSWDQPDKPPRTDSRRKMADLDAMPADIKPLVDVFGIGAVKSMKTLNGYPPAEVVRRALGGTK